MPKPQPINSTTVREEIERLVFEIPGFHTCSVLLNAADSEGHTKAVLRPVKLQDTAAYQLTLSGGHAAHSDNLSRSKAKTAFTAILCAAEEIHVMTSHVDLHVRITKKGRILLTRSRPLERKESAPRAHDRKKDYPLTHIGAGPLLRAIGFSDSQDNILPSMQAKYRQVNEFLRIIDAALPPAALPSDKPLRIVDAGCGKAYLSFSAHAYLAQTRAVPVELTGVDLREDIIASCRATAERLSLAAPSTAFVASDIAAFTPSAPPDLVVSLHACDHASDEAIARGIEWEARTILCAPCCQHDVQQHLKTTGPQRALLRHGILKERLADILADAYRAQILRILGYRVKVVEFVDHEATGRNIMIRAERAVRPGMADVVAEYIELRNAWGVTPYLEKRLAPLLEKVLG